VRKREKLIFSFCPTSKSCCFQLGREDVGRDPGDLDRLKGQPARRCDRIPDKRQGSSFRQHLSLLSKEMAVFAKQDKLFYFSKTKKIVKF
jgi:hypothetical protein